MASARPIAGMAFGHIGADYVKRPLREAEGADLGRTRPLSFIFCLRSSPGRAGPKLQVERIRSNDAALAPTGHKIKPPLH